MRSGDRLVVFGQPDVDGFYYAELVDSGRRGYVPADYLQPAPAPAGASSSRAASSDRPRSSSRHAAASAHRGGGGDATSLSSSAPPPSSRHHPPHDAPPPPRAATTGRRYPPRDDDPASAAAVPGRGGATMPRARPAPELAATGDAGGPRSHGGGVDSSMTRHRRGQ